VSPGIRGLLNSNIRWRRIVTLSRPRGDEMAEKQTLGISCHDAFAVEYQGESKARTGKPIASIVIPTRNRIDELRELLQSIVRQSVPVEVHVMDDGADDATAEMIRLQFPKMRYHRIGTNRGPAFQRNRGIELASCNIVFPIDDDALFASPYTVKQTLSEFDHPRIAAVGIPYINVRQDTIIRQQAPHADKIYTTFAFVGAAHAIRRDVFLKVGEYREHFFIMGEEGDLCLRMLQHGFVTRLGTADPIHHMESPKRNLDRMDYYGHRNNILFAWHNVPMPYFPVHLLATTLNGFAWAIRARRFHKMMRGMACGYLHCYRLRKKRQPVPWRIYQLHRSLKKKGPQSLSSVAVILPPVETSQHGLQS
jgi:GT2 family glycosyltransferase